MTAVDPRALAETILTDINNGIPQPRPLDWPTDDQVSAAAEQAHHNGHCSLCKETT